MESKIPFRQANEISILLTGNSEIKKLNRVYRKKNKPTDVLSFSSHEIPSLPVKSLGDIVVSIEYARAQAKAANVTLDRQVLELLIHGVLHLLGYEHEAVNIKKAKEMFRMQDRILREMD